jgi:DNA-binding NarL/FixJ family response regulator
VGGGKRRTPADDATILGTMQLTAAEVTRRVGRREGEVLRLVVAGQTDREIAAESSASVRSVERHIAHILTKLGVHTRTVAVTAAIVAGLVPPNAPD